MSIISKAGCKARFNKPVYGLAGKYTIGKGIALPFFSTLLDIDRAIDELRIAEQVPPSLETQWSIKELFQREIDENRVRQDIVKGYLLDPKKLKFFNAITIVLMPRNADGKILDTFDEVEANSAPPIPWDGSDPEDAQWNQEGIQVANFGGVQYSTTGLSARLRWDEDRVLAVAVDGQHRLWALRTFREDEKFRGGTLRTVEKQTKIPVIFVLLDPNAGFQNTQDQSDYSIRGISRELFTDLNKNAKTVDRARELILDDKNINAQCVRTLLTSKTAEDSDELLPLSLVRWQDDLNRFDTSYYLNSLVHLDLLVSNLLDISPPRDPMDAKNVKDFIRSINDTLGINGKEVEYEGRALLKYYEEDCCDEDGEPNTPFARLPESYLDSAVEGFKVNFRPWLLSTLLGFKPYKELLIYARTHNLIEGTFGSYQAQTSKHKAIIREQETAKDGNWNRNEILHFQTEISKMKENQWAFKAIFQKALVQLGKLVCFEHRDDILSFLDRLYDNGVLKLDATLPEEPFRLWTFVALNAGNDKIKVATTVEDRIFSLLCLWYYGSCKIKLNVPSDQATSSYRKLLTYFSADKSNAMWPDCKKSFDRLYKGFDTPAFFGKDSEKFTVKQKDELVRSRFTAVFTAGLPPLSKTQDSLQPHSTESIDNDSEE
jgi:hypothetical protein